MSVKMEKLTDVLQKVENGKMDSIVAFDIILDLFAVSNRFCVVCGKPINCTPPTCSQECTQKYVSNGC